MPEERRKSIQREEDSQNGCQKKEDKASKEKRTLKMDAKSEKTEKIIAVFTTVLSVEKTYDILAVN